MIKKNTQAIFEDGDYQGEYNWDGGIPLTEGEIITVTTNGVSLTYKLVKKETMFEDKGEDQMATIVYTFQLK